MTALRTFAIVALAAATVAVGSLATVPTASAMPLSCTVSWRSPKATLVKGKTVGIVFTHFPIYCKS